MIEGKESQLAYASRILCKNSEYLLEKKKHGGKTKTHAKNLFKSIPYPFSRNISSNKARGKVPPIKTKIWNPIIR